jgi:hypothetical protein
MVFESGIKAISYGADGTDTERYAQQNMDTTCTPTSLNFEIPFYGIRFAAPIMPDSGLPLVSVQDSKHEKKTARNNIFSGAHILTTGNDTIRYNQILEFSRHPGTTLYERDVKNVDRQDDRAAYRLFASGTLGALMKMDWGRTPMALVIYLFVLGDLFDAYQNRTVDHGERVRMVMRAYFFLTSWADFIDSHPHYTRAKHFISRQSFEIFLEIARSLILLILTHRSYFSDIPLLPWLHGTEQNEHIFWNHAADCGRFHVARRVDDDAENEGHSKRVR